MLHTLLSVSLIFFVVYGIEGSGVSPEELLVRVNDTFKIRCFIDIASGELNFYDGDILVPNGSVKRIDSRHIELTQMYTKPIEKNFTCKKNQSKVGRATVRVEEDQIKKVKSFKCRTNNLTTVTCSFMQPESFVPIKYKLKFSLNGGQKKYRVELKGDGKHGYSSGININNQNFTDSMIHFALEAKNKFTNSTEKFSMKLLEIFTPRKVEEMKVGDDDSTTHNSSIVTFVLQKELVPVLREMIFDVRLTDEFNNKSWRKIENPRLQIKGTQGFLVLDGLEFANTKYRIKLRSKMKIAMDTDEMWSPYTEITFVTKPTAPVKVPETCRNCFNVMDNENIVVYWTAVPKKLQNAEKFAYQVRGWNEQNDEIVNRNLTETSMIIPRNLNAENVRFEIYSTNEKGISENFSRLIVPLKSEKKKLLKIQKELINFEYRISWKSWESNVESFTVVSCQQRNELPNQCESPISIINLKNNITEYNVEANFSKQFGVAVNLRENLPAQGFEWASCTAAEPKEIGEIHSMWTSVISERSITLQWQLNCFDEPVVVGYNITYCPVENNFNNCSETMRWEITMGNDVRQFKIANLQAFKRYRVSMALLSHTRHGVFKTPIIVQTLESAPTAPQNLKALIIRQHTVDLSWNRPQEVNGEAMTYQLWYNDHKININDNNTMNETFKFHLQGLEAYTNYTVTVVACTSFCSDLNENLKLRTAIGEPGLMFQPRLESFDENKVMISWDEPKIAGGKLDYFQLKTISNDGEIKMYRINGRARTCVIKSLKCDNIKIDIAIRSVNVEHPSMMALKTESVDCFDFHEPIEGEVEGQFYGEWSQLSTFYCQIHFSFTMMLAIFLLSFFLLYSIYIFIRLYQKYKEMKDIHIVWPKGLDPDSPPSSPSKTQAVKNLDLIKDHALTVIEEEEEERTKFIAGASVVASENPPAIHRESDKSELFLPFICNPKTNEIVYTMPKISTINEKMKGASTPSKMPESDYVKISPKSETLTNYVKMYAPIDSPTKTPIEGYLDMSGKSPTSPKIVASMPIPKEPDYLVNEIKMFIKDSELNNNGYIGKRASVLSDTGIKKHSMIVNSNGYVGLQQKK